MSGFHSADEMESPLSLPFSTRLCQYIEGGSNEKCYKVDRKG